jgi:hypothetical protein
MSDCEICRQILEDLYTRDEAVHQPMSISLLDIARPAKTKSTDPAFMPYYRGLMLDFRSGK